MLRLIRNSFHKHFTSRTVVGKDHHGNKYFVYQEGIDEEWRRAWKPAKTHSPEDFQDAPVPVEWQSWLHWQREEPPTQEEVVAGIEAAEIRIARAAAVDARDKKLQEEEQRARGVSSTTQEGSKHFKDSSRDAPRPKFEAWKPS
eukprot:TRINITY_DN18298_c0_g1_i5.p1 TRINITY_DN18298_c0_g1~~TRINITY_DN18298_c0_g1_i5.p1  ORF type:complete len:144 (+),score=29.28 TRINITY_DN18298_c0_g1_i5:139-570(+)